MLARAATLEPECYALPSFADAGSLAWWCRWLLDALQEEYLLGACLHPEEVEPVLSLARYRLGELDADVLSPLLHLFPVIERWR